MKSVNIGEDTYFRWSRYLQVSGAGNSDTCHNDMTYEFNCGVEDVKDCQDVKGEYDASGEHNLYRRVVCQEYKGTVCEKCVPACSTEGLYQCAKARCTTGPTCADSEPLLYFTESICGTSCLGLKQPDCSCASSTCADHTCSNRNACGSSQCQGTKPLTAHWENICAKNTGTSCAGKDNVLGHIEKTCISSNLCGTCDGSPIGTAIDVTPKQSCQYSC